MQIEIKDDFDLDKIAESGQCFRWNKMGEGKYRILHASRCLIIQKESEYIYSVDCNENEFKTIWMPYFDLDENYYRIRNRIKREEDPFLAEAVKNETGIRILRQHPWEALISFIISQNRNIPAIKKSIELLSEKAGIEKKDSEGRRYYTFPTPQCLNQLSIEELNQCKLGYRSKYIKAVSEAVALGEFDLNRLAEVSDNEALHELTKLFGVGEKVATCVLLYGLHRLNAFPVDVWVKRILSNEYAGGYPMEKYAPYNGVYQQYMFAYYRNT